MKVAVVGLGKMGMQIANRFSLAKHEVIASDVSFAQAQVAQKQFLAMPAASKNEVIKLFGNDQKIIWLMIPSEAVDAEIDAWIKLLKSGDIIIDGGNSNFQLTQERYKRTKAVGIELVDVGTSGGVLGFVRGFCLMVGGDQTAFKTIEPLLKSLTAPEGDYKYLGPSGAGHYVKMIHNAVEYGAMESLAEGYHMLKEGPFPQLNLSEIGELWEQGSIIASDLNVLASEILAENPELRGIEGKVGELGEARWAVEFANQKGLPMPAIKAALDVRQSSQSGQVNFATKLLAALRNKFGGHNLNQQ